MKSRKLIWLAGAMLVSILISACNIGATPPSNEDPGAIQTQAFEIVLTQSALQQTQTAAAVPPTPLPTNTLVATITLVPLPTSSNLDATNTPFSLNTQQPGLTPQLLITPTVGIVNTLTTKNGCNDGQYLAESGYVDGTPIDANKNYNKSFMLHNTGECDWDEGYSFAFIPELSTPGFEGYTINLVKNKPEDYTKAGYGQTFVLKLKAPKESGTYKGYWKLKDDAGNFFGPLVWIEVVVK
ncbi:MAG: hypothetical protein HC797_04520 [Anaerolineales bacterium]|nr:hypothetical protein [Anaerolineales bacterium]